MNDFSLFGKAGIEQRHNDRCSWKGSGCGAIGTAIASEIRRSRFESRHQHTILFGDFGHGPYSQKKCHVKLFTSSNRFQQRSATSARTSPRGRPSTSCLRTSTKPTLRPASSGQARSMTTKRTSWPSSSFSSRYLMSQMAIFDQSEVAN